jgi:hypothetical protein
MANFGTVIICVHTVEVTANNTSYEMRYRGDGGEEGR